MSKKNKKHQTKKTAHKKPSPASQPSKVQSHPPQVTSMVVQTQFTATVTMLSDWHIGTGAGRSGDIDSLVQRDPDNLPYIPAKTLTGIWRDACEVMALGLDDSNTRGTWSQWVNYVFGNQPALPQEETEEIPRETNMSDQENITVGLPQEETEEIPREATLSIRAAYLPNNLKQVIASKPKHIAHEIKEAITFIKPGIRIDPATGCAEQECLRFEEMVRAKATLQASCQLNLDGLNEEQQQAAYALIVAGTQLVERIGGNRRRGAGRCQLAIEGVKPQQSIDWIAKHLEEAPLPPKNLPSRDSSDWNNHQIDDNSPWVAVRIRIKTESSLVIAKRTVGNVVETLDYIPGTHLLGLVVRKLRCLRINISGAIAHGDVVITNATVDVGGERGQPVPYALFGEKLNGGLDKLGQQGVVYNRLKEKEEEQKQLKGERQGYIGTINSSHLLAYSKVKIGVETHNTITDEVQHPTSDEGGVYSYQTIAPNTVFQAELRLPKLLATQLAQQQKDWWKKLEGRERLGQSKKDDYGLVSITVLDSPKTLSKTVNIQNSELTVWLLSDVLLRDERLRPTTSLDALIKELGNHLNVNLNLRDKDADGLLSLVARQRRLESWQVRWRLPRPSLVGLSAGSCFVFEVEGNLDTDKLMQLEITGIGERCAEGYGQLCFNEPLLVDKTSHLKGEGEKPEQNNQKSVPPNLIQQGNQAFKFARIIEKAAWRTAIQRAALRVAGSSTERQEVLGINIQSTAITTMSQLGGFRSLVNRLQTPEDSLIRGWFGNQAGSDAEKDKWKKRNDKWGEKLQIPYDLVTIPGKIWQLLKLENNQLILTQDAESSLKAELWAEAVQTLVDTCIRAYKREKEKENKDGTEN